MTEPKVRRYSFYGDWDGNAHPEENPGGGWVDYDDYARLAARVQELERLVEGYRLNAYDDTAEITRLREAVKQGQKLYCDCSYEGQCMWCAALREKP